MAHELGFNFQEAGIYSSLPHLARFLAGFVFGWIGDYLRRRNTSSNCIRKSFCTFCEYNLFIHFHVSIVCADVKS